MSAEPYPHHSPDHAGGVRNERRSAARRRALSRRGFLGVGATAAVFALAGCGSNTEQAFSGTAATGEPEPGGILRVGLAGGGAADVVDAHVPVTTPDGGRVINLYDRLYEFDQDYEPVPALAVSAEPVGLLHG